MKSLKESLLDSEEDIYNNTLIGKIGPQLSILETIHKRIIKNNGCIDISKLSGGITDANGQKLNIGDLVIFPTITGEAGNHYKPRTFIMVGVVVKLVYDHPGGPCVQLLLTNEYNEEVQDDIENCRYSSETSCVYCGQCIKVDKSFVKNLYK